MSYLPLLALVGAVGLLLLAIVRFRLHPFLALTVVSLLLGPAAGLSPEATAKALLGGFGNTLEWIGVVIVLGALLGELLNESGATLTISDAILRAVGTRRLPLAMGITGYVVSIPAFVDVAYIMLRPITETLAGRTGRPILVVGLSLVAGLTASHALVPPTPGPLAAAGILHADLGRMILLTGFVASWGVVGGLLWSTFYCRRVVIGYDAELRGRTEAEARSHASDAHSRRTTLFAFLPILLPLALIAARSFLNAQSESVAVVGLRVLGLPVVALLLGLVLATLLLPAKGRLAQVNTLLERSIERSAGVLLITGAGGGFGGVIKAAGLGEDIASAFAAAALPNILFPFLLAAALTTATGSLTVAMTASASIVASMGDALGLSPEMAVALIGAGSLCVVHANASLFWLLSRLHDVRPDILYKTYSAQSVCMAAGGFAGALLLYLCGVR